jgi:hypothetical protein
MRITGTFLDEISYDIPHQNWGREEWDKDFASMKAMGIQTVILIRCGVGRWMTYPSQILERERGGFTPPIDLVQMFLELAEKHRLDFYFGTYDAGFWHRGEHQKELDINRRVADEAWKRYGKMPAFKGWYLTQEVSKNLKGIVEIFAAMGRHCKELSGGLPVLISPYIEGSKSVPVESNQIQRDGSITPEAHEKEWNEIMAGIAGAVDIVAFQDGHVDFAELYDFLKINKTLADKYGIKCWTNSETFDRDMPIKFLPIKWEKLLLKLNAAQKAGYENAITFEFSHFLSPNSCYFQAHGLYRRYCEHFGIKVP